VVKDVIPKVHGTVQTLGCAVLRRNRCVSDPNAMVDEENPRSSTNSFDGGLEKDESNISNECEVNPSKNSLMSTLSLDKFEAR